MFCEMSFGRPLVLRGHLRPHAFGPSSAMRTPAPAPARSHQALASVALYQPPSAKSPPAALPSTLSLIRSERNKLIQRVRSDRRAIAQLQSADKYPTQRAKGLLGSRAAVHMLHEMDQAAPHVHPRSSPLRLLACSPLLPPRLPSCVPTCRRR